MRALLEIMSGHLASRRIRLQAGALLRVGRAEPCELVLPPEEHLAAAHFALEFDGASCRLQVPESAFLPRLLQQGWGRSWGVFLTSRLPFAEVRRHWRRFLFVQDATGREVYLRFYDPRVLRGLLPALSTAQAAAFFEGMDSLLLEEKGAQELLSYTWRQGQVVREREALERGASHDNA